MKNKIKYSKLEIREEKEENMVAIDKTRLVEIEEKFQLHLTRRDYAVIQHRQDGPFEGKAIYLSPRYDWVLGEDDRGAICLVPLEPRENIEE